MYVVRPHSDDPYAQSRIWITPPRYVVTTIDEFAEAISIAIARYEVLPLSPEVIKTRLTQ